MKKWFRHGSFDEEPEVQLPTSYIRPPQRHDPVGIGCHHCGGENVQEYEECDPVTLQVFNVLYICGDCEASWSYKVKK
jgi:hypothetical protein